MGATEGSQAPAFWDWNIYLVPPMHMYIGIKKLMHGCSSSSWSQIFGFTKFDAFFPIPHTVHLKCLKCLPKHEKSTSVSAVPWYNMSSSLAVSHFSSTISHCERAASSFIMKTLEKHDCLVVKVESSCCV